MAEIETISNLCNTPVKKILILSANPKTNARLRLDEEVREIQEGLQRSKYRSQFKIQSNPAVRPRDFRRALLDYEPQIVHFTGHGNKEGLLVEDKLGKAVRLSSKALSGLFELFSDKIECVILSACHSVPQANAISKHINYVIGMKDEIDDKAAIEFAVGFYDALGAGRAVEEAFKFGINAVLQIFPDLPEHLIPILKKKKGLRKKETQLYSDFNLIQNNANQCSKVSIIEAKEKTAKIYARDLADKLENRNRKKICVFLGAGASISSVGANFTTLKKKISTEFGKNIDESDIEDYFSILFNEIEPNRRPIFIKDFLNLNGRPSKGYIHLATLAKHGLIDCVITTNFDFFLEKAGEIISDNSSIFSVYIPHLLHKDVSLEELDSSRVPIIKIHGDCSHGIYDITNDELNRSTYPEKTINLLHQVFKTHEIIFIGYGGHEKKLAKALMPIINELNGIYWFNPQPASTATKLYPVIEDHLLYEDLPTDESDLFFDNVMEEIVSTVFSKDIYFDKPGEQSEESYIVHIKSQVAKWNHRKLTQRISDNDESVNISDVFISRNTIEQELKNFFRSKTSIFILVGKSGFGKTTLLKKIASDFTNAENSCMFIPVKTLPKELLRTVGIEKGGFIKKILDSYLEITPSDLRRIGKELESNERIFFIILDGINEFSINYGECENFYNMVYESAEYLESLNITRIKFVISCRNETWYQLQRCYSQFLKKSVFYNSGTPIILNQFDDFEFKQAYEKYKVAYSIKTNYEKLLPLAKERLMDPFTLNLACVAKKGDEISFETPSVGLYNMFFKIKFERIYQSEIDIPLKYLSDFAQRCFDLKVSILEIMDIPPRPDGDLLRYLLDLNILEKDEGADKNTYYSWSHDRFFSFFLSKALRSIRLNDEKDLLPLLEQSSSFLPLYGALKFILLSWQDIQLFVDLLNSKNEDIQSILKDVLFEMSQSFPKMFKQIFESYSNQQVTIEGMRLLLQATSLNTALKEHVFQLMVTSEEPYVQAESNYFFITLCIKEINEKGYIMSRQSLTETLWLDRTDSCWMNIIILLSLLSRLGWDNMLGDLETYYFIIRNLLKEEFLRVTPDDIANISRKLEIEEYRKKYFFSVKSIESFFERSEEELMGLQQFIDILMSSNISSFKISVEFEIVKRYIHCECKISRLIYRIVLIFLTKIYPDEIKAFLLEYLNNAKSPTEGNTCSALAAYINISNGFVDKEFIYRMNEFFLKDRTEMLKFETDYEELFNPIGTYGFIFPIKNKGKAIDLFDTYIKKYLKNKENKLLLRVLHALRQSISLYPNEGLETLRPFLDYREDVNVRQRMIGVLGESYARNPEITNIFINKFESYFSRKELHQIKFGVDHKIYAHSITILEWSRVYHFLFSQKDAKQNVYRILTDMNRAHSLHEILEKIVAYINQ